VAEPIPYQLTDLDALRALTHPRRQRIIQHLSAHGPATSASLARDLGLNTGATSYHLRELARYGFVEEAPDHPHGRERWWQVVRRDMRFPRRSEQTPEMRPVVDEVNRLAFAEDLEMFTRAQAEQAAGDQWADAFPFSRSTLNLTFFELLAFFEDYIALVNSYKRPEGEAPRPDARPVLARFLAFPAPAPARED